MDILPPNPRIVGTTEIPARKARKAPTGGKRRPGRFYLHGGERSAFARSILENLTPGQATIIEFDDAETLQRYMLVFHNVNKYSKTHAYTPVRTRTLGLRLVIWIHEDAAQMRLL